MPLWRLKNNYVAIFGVSRAEIYEITSGRRKNPVTSRYWDNFMVMQSPFWNVYSLLRMFCGVSRVSGMISNLSVCVSEHFECNPRKLILVAKVKFRDLSSTALVKVVGGISFVRLPYRFKSFGNGLEGSPGLVLNSRPPSTSLCGAIFKIREPVLDTLICSMSGELGSPR